jgi:hypothetical protein
MSEHKVVLQKLIELEKEITTLRREHIKECKIHNQPLDSSYTKVLTILRDMVKNYKEQFDKWQQ